MHISRKSRQRLAVAIGAATLWGCSKSRTEELNLGPPAVVERVELERYAGKWFEVARLPNSFQKGCSQTTAEYSLRDDGKIRVVNRCLKGSPDEGKWKSIEGTAKVVDRETGAKLAVSFFWPFFGDYWIVELADDYSYAAVGTPSRDNAWILSREPELAPSVYSAIVRKLADQGFDVEKLIRTPQGGDASPQKQTASE